MTFITLKKGKKKLKNRTNYLCISVLYEGDNFWEAEKGY